MLSLLLSLAALHLVQPSSYFGIQVIDEATGRGVPLIELKTVNNIRLYTDSAGWIAFEEPGLMSREVFFFVEGPGYEFQQDGFGFRGVRLFTAPGKTATLRIKRKNIAERMYRMTGQGIYRDSELLGKPAPLQIQDAVTLGQDSVQLTTYQGKLFWLWGDTNLAFYPLGNFHTTAATSPLPGKAFDLNQGIPLRYFMDEKQQSRVRRMIPVQEHEPGPVWLFGLLSVRDKEGKESLLAHYTRRKNLTIQYEHGIVRFNDQLGIFERIKKLEENNTWQFPRHNAVRVTHHDGEYYYFAFPFCTTRVRATLNDICNPSQYEAFVYDEALQRYQWSREGVPVTQETEQQLIKTGRLRKEEACYDLRDDQGKLVILHRASIQWNVFRKKWILIGNEQGGKETPSKLGEVWFAESEKVTGPWKRAVKIATHPRYSFYNPRHHVELDQDDGRLIFFEGTYTTSFSGNLMSTPRYEYNQILYRLDLKDPRLK